VAELTQADRLQPSLLDRLTDDQPGKTAESRSARVMTMAQLRHAVLRDLGWLLNTSSRAEFEEIGNFPEVARSVLNYGIDDLCGTTASGIAEGEVERSIRATIELFEPRVLSRGLSVKLIRSEGDRGPTVISLEISGEMWGRPLPEQLYIRTEIDLDTGECSLAEAANG
jgi:type VI secretion system protein ImpF